VAYEKSDLITRLIQFKDENGRLPTRKDFKGKRITPNKNVYYKIFGDMKNAAKQVDLLQQGELVFEAGKSVWHPALKGYRFRCPFCGSGLQAPFNYATCKDYILSRFMDHIKNNLKNKDYLDAVFDCLASVFGEANADVEKALRAEGFFSAYQKRNGEKT